MSRTEERQITETEVDATLLEAIAGGDREALSGLFNRYSNAIHDYLRCIGAGEELAVDAICDVFSRLWRSKDARKAAAAPRATLFGMAHKAAFRIARKRGLPFAEAPAPADPAPPPSHLSVARLKPEAQDDANLAQEALQPISGPNRRVFPLSETARLTYAEIALALNETRERVAAAKAAGWMEFATGFAAMAEDKGLAAAAERIELDADLARLAIHYADGEVSPEDSLRMEAALDEGGPAALFYEQLHRMRESIRNLAGARRSPALFERIDETLRRAERRWRAWRIQFISLSVALLLAIGAGWTAWLLSDAIRKDKTMTWLHRRGLLHKLPPLPFERDGERAAWARILGGQAVLTTADGRREYVAGPELTLLAGEILQADPDARVHLIFADGSQIAIQEGARVSALPDGEEMRLILSSGKAWGSVFPRTKPLYLKTPNAQLWTLAADFALSVDHGPGAEEAKPAGPRLLAPGSAAADGQTAANDQSSIAPDAGAILTKAVIRSGALVFGNIAEGEGLNSVGMMGETIHILGGDEPMRQETLRRDPDLAWGLAAGTDPVFAAVEDFGNWRRGLRNALAMHDLQAVRDESTTRTLDVLWPSWRPESLDEAWQVGALPQRLASLSEVEVLSAEESKGFVVITLRLPSEVPRRTRLVMAYDENDQVWRPERLLGIPLDPQAAPFAGKTLENRTMPSTEIIARIPGDGAPPAVLRAVDV